MRNNHHDSQKGKGSETILFRPSEPGSRKGPQFTIKNHGMGTEIAVPVIDADSKVWNQSQGILGRIAHLDNSSYSPQSCLLLRVVRCANV